MLHGGDREMSRRQGDRPGYLSSEQVWCAEITFTFEDEKQFKCNKTSQSCCPRPVGRPWLCDLGLRHCCEAEQQVCEGSWQESENCSKAGNAGKCSQFDPIFLFLNVCSFRWRTMWSKLRSWSSALRTSPVSVYWKDSKSRCSNNGWATFLDTLHAGAFDDGG